MFYSFEIPLVCIKIDSNVSINLSIYLVSLKLPSKIKILIIVRGDWDSRANLMPIYGDLCQIKL